MRKRLREAALVSVLALLMLGADGTEARFEKVGHAMICTCGCGQILLECNHVGCPVSPVMISELRQQLTTGLPDTGVYNWFIAKYGAVVLAAPIRGGFDTVAWVMPLAVFVLGTVGTGLLVRRWAARQGPAVLVTGSEGDLTAEQRARLDRIRRETEF